MIRIIVKTRGISLLSLPEEMYGRVVIERMKSAG